MATATIYCDACGAAIQQQARFCFSCGKPLLQTSPLPPAISDPDLYSISASTSTGNLPARYLLKQRYRLHSLLGEGGMGAVYKAEDEEFGNRLVAVKEMRLAGLNPDEVEEAIDAFKREALLLAGLMHPNIPRIYDHFNEAGHWYLIMDFIDGQTLEQRVNKSEVGCLSVEEVIEIGLQLCTALDYLHTRRPPIIFRDLKPANIIGSARGQIYLIDFGIARHFKPGQLRDTIPFGSVGYAAPEQYGRVQTSPRADIYSLGATLHHLLSGHNPALSPFRFAPLLRQDQIVPAELETLIAHMVELDENKRPASIAIIQQELQRINARKVTAHIDTVRLEVKSEQPSPLTTRRLAPIGTTLLTYRGHTDRVLGVAWSPNSKYLASAAADKTVQVWDATSGELLMSYPEHTEWVKAVVWSPDGKYIASAGADTTVHIWDTITGRTALIYRGHTNIVTTLDWSPDGKYLVSAGYDRSINVWNAYSGEEFGFYYGHSPLNTLNAVSWSPDSRYVASASDDKTVHVWPIEQTKGATIRQERSTRKLTFTYSKHTGWVKAVAWSPNGKRIASGSWDNVVHVWDASDGRFVYVHSAHASWINALAWSPNSVRIASASNDGTVHVWEANTGREIFTDRTFFIYKGHSDNIRAVAWSPDGTRIASASHDTTVQVWDAG